MQRRLQTQQMEAVHHNPAAGPSPAAQLQWKTSTRAMIPPAILIPTKGPAKASREVPLMCFYEYGIQPGHAAWHTGNGGQALP